jgi:hypothetical protein
MAIPLLVGAAAAGMIARTVLKAIGIGVISIVGAAGLVTGVESLVRGYVTGLPTDVLSMLGLLRIDLCINVALAGVTLRLTVAGAKRFGIL